MDRVAWLATVREVTKTCTWLKSLSAHAHTHGNCMTLQTILCFSKIHVKNVTPSTSECDFLEIGNLRR